MHPDLWLSEPTIQMVHLTDPGSGGVNQSEIRIDIMEIDGTPTGTKGLRPSLTLAGDVNLDGKVDVLDIQDSISQLGTNPQAVGVMPIADSNGDQIIDATDIAVVLDGYGQTTDVYEGLWDGTRLLSVAAGSAGFGSLSGVGAVGGGTQFGGGPRPNDDCLNLLAPPDSPVTLVPMLLREDARGRCGECPEYEDNPNCYSCESDKGVSGGSVTASPEQPLTTDTVTFTVAGVSETPGTLKCNESCGDDGATVPTPLGDPSYVWQVLTKGENGWPEEADPNDGHIGWPSGTTVTAGGNACQEKKAICWARPSSPCVPDPAWTRVGEKTVQFSDFTLSSETILEAHDGTSDDRTTLGISEIVRVKVVEPGVSVTWEVEGGIRLGPTTTEVRARRTSKGAMTVRAISTADGTCQRTLTFQVIEPDGIRMTFSGDLWHEQGKSSAGFQMCCQVIPTSVNFSWLRIGERESQPPTKSGEFLQISNAHGTWTMGHTPWYLDVEPDGYLDNTDKPNTWFSPTEAPIGGWDAGDLVWSIPWKYYNRVTGLNVDSVIDVSESTSHVDSSGAMWINKSTQNGGGSYQSPTYGINSISDPWGPSSTCP